MSKDFNDFWTEKDDSIKIDFTFDPLGVMVIWRLFAQEIFGYKITTVANNMRFYLINLFNLSTIRLLIRNNRIKEKYLNQHYNEVKLRDDLIIFLENLFVYCSSKGNELFVVPGVAKFESLKKHKKFIIGFEGQSEKYEILIRQLQLGISGRYKTPFREMGLNYKNIYDNSQSGNSWKEALSLIKTAYNKKNEYTNWVDNLINFLVNHPNKIEYASLNNNICKFITKYFLEKIEIPNELLEYLLEKIGLVEDTAKILFDIVRENKDNDIDVKYVFMKCLEKENDEKIKNIIALESFLAPIQHVFDGIIETNNEDISDYKILEEKLPKYEKDKINEKILDNSETAKKRFFKLIEVVESEDKIKNLINYHNEVQKERGSPAWVFLDGNDKINRVKLFGERITVKEWLNKSKKERRFDKWKNDYYISSLKSIIESMDAK